MWKGYKSRSLWFALLDKLRLIVGFNPIILDGILLLCPFNHNLWFLHAVLLWKIESRIWLFSVPYCVLAFTEAGWCGHGLCRCSCFIELYLSNQKMSSIYKRYRCIHTVSIPGFKCKFWEKRKMSHGQMRVGERRVMSITTCSFYAVLIYLVIIHIILSLSLKGSVNHINLISEIIYVPYWRHRD